MPSMSDCSFCAAKKTLCLLLGKLMFMCMKCHREKYPMTHERLKLGDR